MPSSSLPSAAPLLTWLRQSALPYWSTTGTDFTQGGFFERIAYAGERIEEPRRTRVVTRQIYVFAMAERHGWMTGADKLIDHGLRFLLDRLRLPNGTFAASANIDGAKRDERFDLYEQAFALFALATAYQRAEGGSLRPEGHGASDSTFSQANLAAVAANLLEAMNKGWKHPVAGYFAESPQDTALHANPHMHLLEAALEWEATRAPDLSIRFAALADELADIALCHLINPATGALHEHFDSSWKRLPEPQGEVVEPGHQFEWSWLLSRWGALRVRPDALDAAKRLLEVGEQHGVDSVRNAAINELDASLQPVDRAAKLWPQTERIKAWRQAAERATEPAERAEAVSRVDQAVAGLMAYTDGAPAGRWHEVQRPDGSFDQQPTRASSLYHIVCAADTLAQ